MDAARKLEPIEARLLGVLVEKELTTPEQYPLSLNALTAGCNQKNNRDPVLELFDGDVYAAVQKLVKKAVVGSVHPVGARVEKFRHNAAALYELPPQQLAIVCELLLRGPQQPGELRARVARMVEIASQPALLDALAPLMSAGLVVRLDPAPGSRAESYAQTIAPVAASVRAAMPNETIAVATAAPATDLAAVDKRISDLHSEVQMLRRQLSNLAWKLGEKLDPD